MDGREIKGGAAGGTAAGLEDGRGGVEGVEFAAFGCSFGTVGFDEAAVLRQEERLG